MTHNHDSALHPTCPHCHLPIRDDQRSILHDGHAYHQACAPKPGAAGDNNEIYPSLISI